MSDTPDPGAARTERRWRTALSVVAWLTIVQSAIGLVLGVVGLLNLPGLAVNTALGQLAGLIDAGAIVRLEQLMRLAVVLTWLQTGLSGAALGGAIGLLRRQKWGWYATVLLNLGSAFACLAWAPGILTPLLGLLDPARASSSAWTISFLLTLIPASVVVFLLLNPVIRQFERAAA